MKNLLLLSIAALMCSNAYPQGYANNWVFGDSAGLNFNSTPPESFVSSITTYEACASISDSLGNLLFYTNGNKVWNKNNEVMLNGDSLDVGQIDYVEIGSSITQGVIIIPVPENSTKYYILYIAEQFFPVEKLGLRYALVDMNLSGGLGEVIEKNISIYDSITCEKLQAVKHANGRDWWLLARQHSYTTEEINEIQFIRFLITSEAIDGPFYQLFGPDHEWTDNNYGFGGEMVFSPQGDKLAYTAGTNLDIYDFDRCSGELSNVITIYGVDEEFTYGCAFSPDGNKIYITAFGKKILFQYCLNCEEEIDSTQEKIYQISGQYNLAQLELGPDNKIYVATPYLEIPSNVFSVKNKNLCVINNPNELGLTCDFDTNTISLGERRVITGLPNMPNYNLGALAGSECDTLSTALHTINKKDAISIYPNPASTSFIISGDISFGDKMLMYNATGQLLLQEKIIANQTIDTFGIVSGIYYLQIRRDEEIIYREKLVVSRIE